MKKLLIVLNIILVILYGVMAAMLYLEGDIVRGVLNTICASCWLGCVIMNTTSYKIEKRQK